MIRIADMEFRVSKGSPRQMQEILAVLLQIHQGELPFHPLILVLSSGELDNTDCVAMPRSPLPDVGQAFDATLPSTLKNAFNLNPSIHDGAIIFSRSNRKDTYRLTGWSMRIVNNSIPIEIESNRGSAYNSAAAISLSRNVDLCCVLGGDDLLIFKNGYHVYV